MAVVIYLAVFTALTLQSKSNKDFLPLTGAVFSIKYLKLMDKCAELELNLVIASSKILPISACPIGLVCHSSKFLENGSYVYLYIP